MSELLSFLRSNEDKFRSNRLAALYSDFRTLRTTNPDGYTANISAWLSALSHAALAGQLPPSSASPDLLSIRIDAELLRALETKEWGRPLALGTAIHSGIENRSMMPVADFLAAKNSIYSSSWGSVPWKVLAWGLRQLGIVGVSTSAGDEDKLPVGKMVVLPNLEIATQEFAKRTLALSSRTDRIFTKAMFKQQFGKVLNESVRFSDSDMEIFLKYSNRDKGLLAYDGQTVKLKAEEDMLPSAITEEDAAIASLKSLIKDLEAQIGTLTKRVDALGVEAKAAVARKNRTAAMAVLRSKKLAETTLEKRSATLGQLEEVYTKIEQAADQVELVRVMDASANALKSLNKEVGGVERVEQVIDNLHDQMQQTDEVGNVIAEPGRDAAAAVDEAELDDELEKMELEEKRKEEEKAKVLEAEETRKKLRELEEVEKRAGAPKEKMDKEDREAVEGLKRMSLEEQRPKETA